MEDQKIIDLLNRLKDTGGKYPRKLLESRRQEYLRQVASISAGMGLVAGIKEVARPPQSGSPALLPAFPASAIVEAILVVVIVIQAGIVAYRYRDRIADLFQPAISASTTSPMDGAGSSLSEDEVTDTPLGTETMTETQTAIVAGPNGTLVPSGSGSGAGNSAPGQDPSVTGTPDPNGDNGHHYGQTPKPTQEKKEPKSTNENGNNKKP